MLSSGPGAVHGGQPEDATTVHTDRSSGRSSSVTEVSPKVSRRRSSSGTTPSSFPASTLPASVDRVAASLWARAACWVRRAARSTTLATAAATSTKMLRARTFSASAIVSVP